MLSIVANNATEAFELICHHLMQSGVEYECRTSELMRELQDVIVEIQNPAQRIITTSARKFPTKNAKREFMWYMTHNSNVALIAKYLPFWQTCSDDSVTVNSNYGTIWQTQIDVVITRLKKAIESSTAERRAVIQIYDAKFANYTGKDMPCTLSVVLNVRNNKLYMSTMMRSNDVVTGFCIDQFTWTSLQELIANELGLKLGTYTHHAVSMHVYEHHYHMLNKCCNEHLPKHNQSKEQENLKCISNMTTYSNFWQANDPYFAFDAIEFDDWRANVKQTAAVNDADSNTNLTSDKKLSISMM